ncbi:MAG TPA: hypothetical protein VED01_05660 [Burkholderiales bacterium]|nr:hypothetical protein [Burkholderiales bacterium]
MDIEIELASSTGDAAATQHFHVACLSAVEHELRAIHDVTPIGTADGQQPTPGKA